MGIEHHLLRLARIGPHEHHAAVAEPNMGDLHRHGDAVDQDDLAAPVELVGVARRIEQRYVGLGHGRTASLLPALGVAPDRVVAALVAQRPQFLIDADQRQALALLLGVVAIQQGIKLHLPGPDLRLRLVLTLVEEGGLVGPQYPAHRVARHMQLAADPLQRPPLNIERAPDPGDRIH